MGIDEWLDSDNFGFKYQLNVTIVSTGWTRILFADSRRRIIQLSTRAAASFQVAHQDMGSITLAGTFTTLTMTPHTHGILPQLDLWMKGSGTISIDVLEVVKTATFGRKRSQTVNDGKAGLSEIVRLMKERYGDENNADSRNEVDSYNRLLARYSQRQPQGDADFRSVNESRHYLMGPSRRLG
jgi:hypothetical protein